MQSPSTPIIQRQRVIAAVEEALSSSCLALLTAPLGHGKTTVAQQLLAGWKTRSLYLRIKSGWQDNAEYLWEEMCVKLEQQGVRDAVALRLAGVPNDNARMYRCLNFFREYLSTSPTLLVIDDYHNFSCAPIDRFFESLVCEEIPGFNLLVLGREKPLLPLAYLQLKGYATELDSAVVNFSREEARQLFAASGEDDFEMADIAWDFSQGWAAALRLCLLSFLTSNIIKPVRKIEELVSEVFAKTYAREEQCFLLKLSVLESFSAAQAVFLTEDRRAPLRLKKLDQRNAFLQYSPVADSYSIQALLRSFLLQSLAENGLPACADLDVQELYRRAAQCSAQSGNYLQAMRLFAQAGRKEDLLSILRLFETPDDGFFILPAPTAVVELMDGIPWEIRFLSPIGYLGFIHRYMVRVSRPDAAALLQEAESRFLGEAGLSEEMRLKVRGEIELIRSGLSFNDFEAMGRHYEKADMLLQEHSSLVNKSMYWTFNCPHSAFLYLKKPGGYEALEQLVSEKLVHFRNVSGGSNAGARELFSAERLLETGKLHRTADLLDTARYKALESRQYSGILASSFTLARLRLANGRTEGIYELFDALRKPVGRLAHPLLLHNLEVCLGYIASVCNDVERIPSWLLQQEPLTVRNNQAHTFSLIVRGKSILALKNWPRLLAFAEEAEPRIAALGNLFGRLHIMLFKAIAAANMQKHNAASSERYLRQALELAQADGIVACVAEYGNHLYPLVQRLSLLHPERRELGPLLRTIKSYARLGKGHSPKLTLRETEIMEMVREGANNKDIGARLGITQGSVANRLSRIYFKLGVDSRIEAVNKWSEER